MRFIVFRGTSTTRSFEHYIAVAPQLGPDDVAIQWNIENEDYDPYNYLRSGSSISHSPITRTPLATPDHQHVFNELITVPGSPAEIFQWIPFWNDYHDHPIMPILWDASSRQEIGWLTLSWRVIMERWSTEAGYPLVGS